MTNDAIEELANPGGEPDPSVTTDIDLEAGTITLTHAPTGQTMVLPFSAAWHLAASMLGRITTEIAPYPEAPTYDGPCPPWCITREGSRSWWIHGSAKGAPFAIEDHHHTYRGQVETELGVQDDVTDIHVKLVQHIYRDPAPLVALEGDWLDAREALKLTPDTADDLAGLLVAAAEEARATATWKHEQRHRTAVAV